MGTQNLKPLDELKTLDQQVELINDLPGLKPIFFRLEEIAKQHPNDFQVQLMVGDLKQHLVNRGSKLKHQPAPPPLAAMPAAAPPPMPPPMPPPQASGPPPMPEPAAAPPSMPPPIAGPPPMPQPAAAPPPIVSEAKTVALPTVPAAPPPRLPADPVASAPPPRLPADPVAAAPPPPLPADPAPSAPPPLLPPEPPAPIQTAPQPVQYAQAKPDAKPAVTVSGPVNWKRALWMGGIVGAMFALVGVAALIRSRRNHQDAVPAGIQIEIATTPTGASVRINDTTCTSDCKLSLPPGNYQVTAFLDGYEPAASGITVAAGSPASFSLALEPQAQSLRILTDLPQGKIVIDDQPPADLTEGQFIVDKIAPGAHTVKLTGKTGEASFSFTIEPAKIPTVTGPVAAKNLSAVMVASLGNQAHVVANSGPLKLQVNGQPEADAGPSGTDLKSFQAGVDELIIGEGKDQRSVKESFGPAPMLTAFLRSDLNIGTLIVSTGKEDGVRVFVNNREAPQRTQRGQVRIQTIGPVSVRVMKDGFEQPAVQTAEVKKGTDTRLDFTLKALPQLSTLQITGGTPGAEVTIDQRNVGTIGPDGSFTSAGLTPGDHTVGIRRDQFTPRQLPRTFRAGQTTVISGADAVLTAERKEPPPAAPSNKQTTPPPAPKEVATATPPSPAAGTMADWEDNNVWRQENGVYMHQGAAFIPYKLPPKGIFTFTVQLLKGGNLFRGGKIRWALDRMDDKNYALYEMDSKNFWAKVVAKGKTLERTHIPLKDLEKQKSFTIQIDVVPEHIVHKMFAGGEWITLDSWAETGRNFSEGKFGFVVQGNDEIGISEFKFQPK